MPASTRTSDDALDWFVSGFSARDLADPLLSVDEGTATRSAAAILARNGAEVLGVRQAGIVNGWIDAAGLEAGDAVSCGSPFVPPMVVAETTSLSEVVCLLNDQPRLFVRALGQVGGVIPRAAVEKPPLRMWLFGLVTIAELRMANVIEEMFPNDGWQSQLSPGRLAKAQELQRLRHRRGQRPTLLDCLQFADKGHLVARNEAIRRHTRFASRSAVERFVQALQDLRNNLAHAQDISGDWDVIHDLAANVHRIVCGTRDEPSSANADGQASTSGADSL